MTTTVELLDALEGHLRDPVQRELNGALAFQNRIAANLVALLRREVSLGPSLATLDAQFASQAQLHGEDLWSELARALRDGVEIDGDILRPYLQRRVLLQMAIDNPRYSGFRQARNRWPELQHEAP